jgi:hypothetical protein
LTSFINLPYQLRLFFSVFSSLKSSHITRTNYISLIKKSLLSILNSIQWIKFLLEKQISPPHSIWFWQFPSPKNVLQMNCVIIFFIFMFFKRHESCFNKYFYYGWDFFSLQFLRQQKLFYLKINSWMFAFVKRWKRWWCFNLEASSLHLITLCSNYIFSGVIFGNGADYHEDLNLNYVDNSRHFIQQSHLKLSEFSVIFTSINNFRTSKLILIQFSLFYPKISPCLSLQCFAVTKVKVYET